MSATAQTLPVVIVNWNSHALLRRCLASLSEQTIQNFRVVIVDNGSRPALDGDFTACGFPVEVIRNETNRGFAAAVNQAVAGIENCDWFCLLNPDAWPEPNWLEQLRDAISANPGYAAYANRQLKADDPTVLDGDGDVYHITGLVWRRGHGQPVPRATGPREVFSSCAAAAVYRCDAWRAAGGFDEDFFCYLEDVDLGFRLRLLGHRCLLVPDAVVRHVGSATTGGPRSASAVYYGHRNMVWTFVKNMPWPLLWALLPLHIAANLASIAVLTFRGQGRVVLRAKRDAIKGLRSAIQKRRGVQRLRMVSSGAIWRAMSKAPSRLRNPAF